MPEVIFLRKFHSTQLPTKVMLFNAFCSPKYGCQLQCHFRKDSFNCLRVAYNNALRGAVLVIYLLKMVLILFTL